MSVGGKVTGRDLRTAVLEELERVCVGEAFFHSKQSVRLLRYLVEQSLEHNDDQLRERAIGANLFGRDLRYDTNEDSIVRVSAAEVRKRLARHYHEVDPKPAMHFSIPSGSYRVEFHRETPAPPVVVAEPVKRRVRWTAVSIGMAACGLVAMLLWWLWPVGVMTRFWGPALSDPGAVVILAPHPIVYTFTKEIFQRFRGDVASHSQRQIEQLTGPPAATIALKDVVRIQDQYIGLGSAHAISNVSALLATRRKAYNIRFGGDFSFQDIRHSPAVLVGAYANRWTMQLTDDYRFALSERDGIPEIYDRKTGKRWSVPNLRPDGKTPEDYVIVSRLFHPKTGRLVVALAGITQYGTRAAGEFVTDVDLLEAALRDAPKHWERMNLQFVLRVPVVEGVPGQPTVVAAHYW